MRIYKTEIALNPKQKEKFFKTIGACRFVYNLFLQENKALYERNKDTELPKYMSNYDFSNYLNNVFIPNNPEYLWIKEVYTKSVSYAINNANIAFINFFKGKSKFPKFKKKDKNDCSMYFVRNDKKSIIHCERHRIKIPTLGWCKLKEFGYIPINSKIISGSISKSADRFYVSVLVEEEVVLKQRNKNDGIGIDLGVKSFAVLSDNTKYETFKQKRLEKRLKHEQNILSRKYESQKISGNITHKNMDKQKIKVQRIYQKLANRRNDYQNKVICEIIKREPSFITIENLNVSGMMKNRHLSKAIANQNFYRFVENLKYKCYINGIELRQVDRFYASSKTCCKCGIIKQDLTLKDRIYKCDCGNIIDRDFNASINLKNAKEYKIIA